MKTIDLKGKKYIPVSERVLAFNEEYKNGSIVSELMTAPEKAGIKGEVIVVKATVTPDCDKPTRNFVDYSQVVVGVGMVNTTAALENACTSAVGRALAMMGIGVIDSIASADEIIKATSPSGGPVPVPKTYQLRKPPVGQAWVAPAKTPPRPPTMPPDTSEGAPF